jgi:hypothetical protein
MERVSNETKVENMKQVKKRMCTSCFETCFPSSDAHGLELPTMKSFQSTLRSIPSFDVFKKICCKEKSMETVIR